MCTVFDRAPRPGRQNQHQRLPFSGVLAGAVGFCLLLASVVAAAAGMQALEDEEMRDVTGQALFLADKIVGTGALGTGTAGISFYRAGLDANLGMNLNIKNLELGRTGPGNAVDLWAENVAFGCVANSSGVCVSSTSGTGTQLKPVMLTRPYLEFAVKNDGSPTQREIIGVRLGAENINGPLSFGMMKVFSGYLTASAQLTMEGMTDVAASCGSDALTNWTPATGGCGGSFGGGLQGTGANFFSGSEVVNSSNITVNSTQAQYTVTHLLSSSYTGTRGSLGLENVNVCSLLCAELAEITTNFSTRSTPLLTAAANGMRLTQAQVLQPGLGTLVDNVTSTLTINQCLAGALVCTGADWIPALMRGPVATMLKQQIAAGLGLPDTTNNTLNNTPLGYNLTNFHQVDVNSSNIGLSFQRETVRYPGYALAQGSGPTYIAPADMQKGWTFYLPNAFTLNVSEPAGVFTNNIASGAAGAGNLVALDPVYDNCWGAATFC